MLSCSLSMLSDSLYAGTRTQPRAMVGRQEPEMIQRQCPRYGAAKGGTHHIPEALLPALWPILETICSLTERIRDYDRKLEAISKERYPEIELLRQVEGIGALTALTFVLTLEDPYRFEKSRSVGAYLGLVPATDQSGDSYPREKRISKEGDEMLSVSSW
jgi:transposase